jgi:hypothetical protein
MRCNCTLDLRDRQLPQATAMRRRLADLAASLPVLSPSPTGVGSGSPMVRSEMDVEGKVRRPRCGSLRWGLGVSLPCRSIADRGCRFLSPISPAIIDTRRRLLCMLPVPCGASAIDIIIAMSPTMCVRRQQQTVRYHSNRDSRTTTLDHDERYTRRNTVVAGHDRSLCGRADTSPPSSCRSKMHEAAMGSDEPPQSSVAYSQVHAPRVALRRDPSESTTSR